MGRELAKHDLGVHAAAVGGDHLGGPDAARKEPAHAAKTAEEVAVGDGGLPAEWIDEAAELGVALERDVPQGRPEGADVRLPLDEAQARARPRAGGGAVKRDEQAVSRGQPALAAVVAAAELEGVSEGVLRQEVRRGQRLVFKRLLSVAISS